MCPRTIVFTLAMIVLFGNVAAARDERGFWMGGGVGSVSCPDFLNAMTSSLPPASRCSPVLFPIRHGYSEFDQQPSWQQNENCNNPVCEV